MRTSLHTAIHLKMFFHLQALAPFQVTAFDRKQTITLVPICYFPQFLLSDVPNWFSPNHCMYCSSLLCAHWKQTSLTAPRMTLCLMEAERISMAISTTPSITQAVGCPEPPPVYQHCVKCGIRAGCCSRSCSVCPEEFQPLCSCSAFPLVQPFWLQHSSGSCSAGIFPALCLCGAAFLLLDVFLCQTMLIEWALCQHTWRVPWSSSAVAERENGHCPWHPAIWRKSGGCRSISFFLGDAKMHRRTAATFSIFCICAEFRHKPSSQN